MHEIAVRDRSHIGICEQSAGDRRKTLYSRPRKGNTNDTQIFFPIWLLSAWLAAAGTLGQSPKVVVVADRPRVDVERSLGCKDSTAATGSNGDGNADLINAALTNTNLGYPFYFPGKRWNIQEALVNNPTTGHRWEGNGLSRLDGGTTSPSSLNGPTSKIVWTANQITLSGSAGATGSTADDSSATLTVDLSGVTTNELKLWTLRITGGTNFTPSTYTILSVSGNELTLDRDPSSGGAGSALTGRIQAMDLSSLRVTGVTTLSDGLTISRSTSDQTAVSITGNGTGSGVLLVGGSGGGDGLSVLGSGGGAGFKAVIGSGSTRAILTNGISEIQGLMLTGGLDITRPSGNAVSITATSGHGVSISGGGTDAHGLLLTGGTGGTSDGLKAVAGTGGVPVRGDITGNVTGNLNGAIGGLSDSAHSLISSARIAPPTMHRRCLGR